MKALDHLASLAASRHDKLQQHLLCLFPALFPATGLDPLSSVVLSSPAKSTMLPSPAAKLSLSANVVAGVDGSSAPNRTPGPGPSLRTKGATTLSSAHVTGGAKRQGGSYEVSTPTSGPGKLAAASLDPYDFPCEDDELPPAATEPKVGVPGRSSVGGAVSKVPEEALGHRPDVSADLSADQCLGPSQAEAVNGGDLPAEEGALLESVICNLLCELRLCLAVLENSTFTCVENEEELLKLQVGLPEAARVFPERDGAHCILVQSHNLLGWLPRTQVPVAGGSRPEPSNSSLTTRSTESSPLGPSRPFLPILVSVIRLLTPLLHPSSHSGLRQAVPPAMASAGSRLAHTCIGVLMNLTHQHKDGVAMAVEAGALPALTELLACCSCSDVASEEDGGGGTPGRPLSPSDESFLRPSRSEILQHLDLVTVCFGLLINLSSLYPSNRERLRQIALEGLARLGGGPQAANPADPCGVITLLCSIFDVISSADEDSEGIKKARPSSPHDDFLRCDTGLEVTADELSEGHQQGEAAIVQVSHCTFLQSLKVLMILSTMFIAHSWLDFYASIHQAYSAMLLGFIIIDSAEAQREACALLRSASLRPVAASIRSCLDFYSYTGAITEECKASLVQLLGSLAELSEENSTGLCQ